MTLEQTILQAIQDFEVANPQINLSALAAQQMLASKIADAINQ